MPACCRAGRCGQETRSGSNNSRNRACSFHQGSRHTSEESSRETTTSRPELPAGSHPGSRPSACLPGGRTRTQKGTSIVNQHHTIRLSSWARLVGLALLLGVGLLASLGLASRTAHAQPAMTSTVSTCDDATLRSAINNAASGDRSEEHTSELQSHLNLVCRLLLEKKKKKEQATCTIAR